MLLLLRLIKRFTSLGLVMVCIAAIAASSFAIIVPQVGAMIGSTESTAAELDLGDISQRSEMYAADGSFLTLLVGEVNSEPVTLDMIPQEVIDAVLAMEDADFYSHDGLNYRGTFRALIENVNAGGIAQGGSTITQQLVKQKLLSSEQNLGRKTTEAFYALRVEEKYTKDEILEHYLNIIYLGSGAYGVQAAAETYWGKEVDELGWAEAAMLAGIIRNPTGNDPTLYPERSRDRRAVVADRLVAEGYIDLATGDGIKAAPVPAERQTPYDTKPTDYFIEEALSEILFDEDSPFGETIQDRTAAVYTGGLKIYTTFDPAAQQAALAARDEFEPNDPRNFQIAMAAIDTRSGAVRAMVGGPGFVRDKFNLTTDGLRQPGSTMKAFVLAALFEQGYTPSDDVRADRPCEFENPGGTPNPYEVDARYGGSGGVQSVGAVTRSSNNCAFVRLGQVATTDAVIEVAQKLGISTPLDSVLSLPLGVKEVHPMEMAGAYAAFANDGIYNLPYYVERIENAKGEVLYEHKSDGTRAVSVQTARMLTETLESNVRGGTGTAARLKDGHFAAGKTGTTQDNTDAWFVGSTDYLTTAVWLGNPDEKIPMRNVEGYGNIFGGKVPAATWGMFNNAYHEGLEPVPFAEPERYGGGRYLKSPGEKDFCNKSERGSSTKNTELVDSDGDGKKDCIRIITTTTETTLPPETTTVPVDPNAPTTTAAPRPTTTESG